MGYNIYQTGGGVGEGGGFGVVLVWMAEWERD